MRLQGSRVIPWGWAYDIYYPLARRVSAILRKLGLGMLLKDLKKVSSEQRQMFILSVISIHVICILLFVYDLWIYSIDLYLIGLLLARLSILSGPSIGPEQGIGLTSTDFFLVGILIMSMMILLSLSLKQWRSKETMKPEVLELDEEDMFQIGVPPEPMLTGPLIVGA